MCLSRNGKIERTNHKSCQCLHMCQGLNSHYFHIIGDGHQPNSRAIIRIPIKGGMTIPNIGSGSTMAHMSALGELSCFFYDVFGYLHFDIWREGKIPWLSRGTHRRPHQRSWFSKGFWQQLGPSISIPSITRWWFQIFFIFTPTWGNDPIWLIFFKWETTN